MARKLSCLLFLGGVACIIAGVVTGEGEAGIFIIFPFIYGSGWLMLLGVALVFLSVGAFMFTALPSRTVGRMPPGRDPPHPEKKAGGVILIGPIPVVIASDKKLALALLIVGIAAAIILWLLLPLFL